MKVTDKRKMRTGMDFVQAVNEFKCRQEPLISNGTLIVDLKLSQLSCLHFDHEWKRLWITGSFEESDDQFMVLHSTKTGISQRHDFLHFAFR